MATVKLDVHSNFLRGTIPRWTNSPNLQELNLGNNRLSGPVPSTIATLDLTTLDISENNVQGIIPSDLCRTPEQIELMTVDCEKVACSCCTQCGANRTRAPVLAPFVSPPSPSPTRKPSPPTTSPTTSPTTLPPTAAIDPIESTPAPIAPTRRPTSAPTGCNSFQFSKQCYRVGEPIDLRYLNCDPEFADWIGLYDAATSAQNLFDPLLWHRSCGSKSCTESPTFGGTTLDQSAQGLVSWPLSAGSYRVYLNRNTASAPYQAAFGSEVIRVSQTCP